MNHNPHNLSVGDEVILDERVLVKIFNFTPNQMYATIGNHESEIDTWMVMTNRLEPSDEYYQKIKEQVMDGWDYTSEDMDDDSTEDKVNREADEIFDETYGIIK